MISQLLDVVGYLHQHQIVHLDLKPENILITRIGYEVKLLWPNGGTNDFEDRPLDIEQNLDSDSLILDSLSSHPDDESIPLPPSKNQPEIQKPISSARPENHKSDSSPKQEQLSSSEQLKVDIKAAVLPKFNATLGALPDSVQPGTEQWAQAGWALEKELSNTLKELILSHQDIPMQTVAQEYTSYVQSLITLKFNQNSQNH